MQEIEAKILSIDHDAVVSRLTELGAERDFAGPLVAVYFDDAGGSLSGKEDCLRVRLEGEKAYLTHKGFVSDGDVKVRDEIETAVGDWGVMREIMGRLGFSEWLEIRKYRWSYSLEGVHVVLDRFEGTHAIVPELLEIEAGSAREVRQMATRLGFAEGDLKPWTGAQVFDYYRRQNTR